MARLSLHHPKTNNLTRLEQFFQTLSSSTTITNHNHSVPSLEKKFKRKVKGQRYLDDCVNYLLCAVDRLLLEANIVDSRTPIILFGAGCKPQYGRTMAGAFKLRKHLAKFFPVFVVDEYKTSSVCPKCLDDCESVPDQPRELSCPSCNFSWNRDVGAGFIFFKVFVCRMAFNTRPPNLKQPWHP